MSASTEEIDTFIFVTRTLLLTLIVSHFYSIEFMSMKFFTLLPFIALLTAVASANDDVKERIRQHRESQKLDREVRDYLVNSPLRFD